MRNLTREIQVKTFFKIKCKIWVDGRMQDIRSNVIEELDAPLKEQLDDIGLVDVIFDELGAEI